MFMSQIMECKNIVGNYQLIRQKGLQSLDVYYGILPIDIESIIDSAIQSGYEIGLFDYKKKITIYKSENFHGHEDYKNVCS